MGVAVLAGANSYIQVAFCKTFFIVIVLGLIHGLILLPVALSIFTTNTTTKSFASCLKRNANDNNSDLGINRTVQSSSQTVVSS